MISREFRMRLMLLLLVSLQGIYMLTVCSTVYLGDSGELTAAAFSLGVGHPSGYPLYALLGKVFCLIPIGNVAFRAEPHVRLSWGGQVWLVYSSIRKRTGLRSAGLGAGVLAFIGVFWRQTVSAEVYTLHVFFVALLFWLLLRWDEGSQFYLAFMVFLTGLSFGNHMQTVMLAPGVLWIVFSGDRSALLNGKRFGILTVLFVVALSAYVYLPIRTEAGAAIHWGDPNTLGRFLAHVSGSAHRQVYVKASWESVGRAKEAFLFVWSQFGVLILFSLWGWLRASWRWRVFWLLVIVFDFVYTVFLNTISLEITSFNLPTGIVLSILVGTGIAGLMQKLEHIESVGRGTQKALNVAWSIIPAIGLISNFGLCNQSKNYTGYEQGLNIFMTVGTGDIILMDGDNYVFPVIYHRIVERTREDVRLYDRANLLFKLPFLDSDLGHGEKNWERRRNDAEKKDD